MMTLNLTPPQAGGRVWGRCTDIFVYVSLPIIVPNAALMTALPSSTTIVPNVSKKRPFEGYKEDKVYI
jgi:hypothetical protein